MTNRAPSPSRGETDAPLAVGDGGEKGGHWRGGGFAREPRGDQGQKDSNLETLGIDAHAASCLFPQRMKKMKKVSFNITPSQHAAFERVRIASPLNVEPASAVARRLFLIGLAQADVVKTTTNKSK